MHTRTATIAAVGLALAVLGAGGGPPAGAADPAAPLADRDLANARYRGILDEPVTLVDGVFEGGPAQPGAASRVRVSLVPDFRLHGDLDGDGVDEVAVLLDASFGGSGSFVYLAALARGAEGAVNLGTALVGDRVQVRAGRIEAGAILLDVVQSGPGDAVCCPGQKATRRYRVDANGLVEDEATLSGKAGVADLAGVQWRLLRLAADRPVPEDAGITLSFDGDRVSGSGGCNRFTAAVEAGTLPGELRFGPIGGTRMACAAESMDRESRFFEALAGTTGYGFHAGRLALSWREGDALHSMLFAPAE